MRVKDVKKVGNYLTRILKNPFSRQSRSAIIRYTKELFSLMYEKVKGLDFTMVYQCDSNEHNNNYSKSPRKVLKRIFDDIDFKENHCFVDMGCGKGYVMTVAHEYPFDKICGVEYTPELCEIAVENMKRLNMDDIKVVNCDAKMFDGYSDYDVYYFCNPFDETILSVVAMKISESHKETDCWIYYLNPHQSERQKAIVDAGFKLVRVIKDRNEYYFDINVYKNQSD